MSDRIPNIKLDIHAEEAMCLFMSGKPMTETQLKVVRATLCHVAHVVTNKKVVKAIMKQSKVDGDVLETAKLVCQALALDALISGAKVFEALNGGKPEDNKLN